MDGLEYWCLEHSLCTTLTAKEEASFESSNIPLCFWCNDENDSDCLLAEVIIFIRNNVVSIGQS